MTDRLADGRPVRVLGVDVDPLSIDELNGIIRDAVARDRRVVIAHHNLHSASLVQRDALMRATIARADFVHIDGMPLVWWARLMGHALTARSRVTYVDWMPHLMADAAREGWKVFYLGSKPGVAESGARRLRERFPGLEIEVAHGYFDATPGGVENEAMLSRINASGAEVLMVGMGMPRQEHWILENLDRLNVRVVLPCGAAIDYVAGAVHTPPRWVGRSGLEWLFRLLFEPRRLAHRYLLEPWTLAPVALRELALRVSGRDGTGQ